MKLTLVFLTLLIASNSSNTELFTSQETHCSNDSDCQTWFICNEQKDCKCGDEHWGIIACNNKNRISAILECSCVTYEQESKSTFLGSCFYNCENYYNTHLVYQQLPHKPEILINKSICTPFHRVGLLCGDCEPGHSPLVLSYNLSCVKCPDGHKNWWKFVLAGFVPITCFYFFIVLFKINVTSSRLHGVVWFSQALSSPIFARLILKVIDHHGSPASSLAVKLLLSFFSFWSLNLFYPIIPNICLNITTLQALAVDYLLALYLLILVFISCIIIELYDRKVACIVTAWKPFHNILTKFRKSWDIRTSIIDSFATFFLLSYVKILNVTTDLLVPTIVYTLDSSTPTFRLYYSPTISYFGDNHLPYAALAIIMFILFIIIPTLTLILYPFQFLHKLLSLFPLNWHFLHVFVDTFQGCYKDGTEPEPGTFDCRWFAALTLLFRPLFYIIFSLTLSITFFIYALILLIIFMIAMINIQPFKKASVRYPSTDPTFTILLSLIYVSIIGRGIAITENNQYHSLLTALTISVAIVSILYIAFYTGTWLLSKRKWINLLLNRQ